MAGESPDRSEQRKSSGETTEGERDPRLAMLGRASTSEVDQPTAVFRLPDEPKPSGIAERNPRKDSGVRQPGTETGSVQNDTELRSAVAAWVASADEEPAAESEDVSTTVDSDRGSDRAVKGAGAEKTAMLPQSREESTVERTSVLPEANRDSAEIGTTAGKTVGSAADEVGAADDADSRRGKSAEAGEGPAERAEASSGARQPANGTSRPERPVTVPRGASGSTEKPSAPSATDASTGRSSNTAEGEAVDRLAPTVPRDRPSTGKSAGSSAVTPAERSAGSSTEGDRAGAGSVGDEKAGSGAASDRTKGGVTAAESAGAVGAPKPRGTQSRDTQSRDATTDRSTTDSSTDAVRSTGTARPEPQPRTRPRPESKPDARAESDTDTESKTGPAAAAGRTPGAPSWASRATSASSTAAGEPSPGKPAASEPAKAAPGEAPAKAPDVQAKPSGKTPEAPEKAPGKTPGKTPTTGETPDSPARGSAERAAKGSTEARAKAAPSTSGPSTGAGPAVDQPTAVFKALRKPTPSGDNTAVLKAPPAPRSESHPATKDSPAPRPSTFVPLRSDDGPRTPVANKSGTAAPADKSGTAAPADGKQSPGAPSAGAPAALSEPERTTQQPVPPLPPLDLLAELTNTPPPPNTAVRTLFRRVKIWTPLLAVLLIVFAIVQVLRPLPEPSLKLSTDPTFTFQGNPLSLPFPGEGQGAVAVDGVGMVATYGAQRPAPIASVAKTMTAYVILKDHPITGDQVGPEIAVDQQTEDESKNTDESRVPVSKGEKFNQREMLEMVMIHSANNVARRLARWDAGTEQAFVKKMNDAAKELGMADTLYTDPSGLAETTISTPQDQLKLAQAVMKNDIFREIVNTPSKEIPGLGIKLQNGNDRALLKDGVGGIKTGSSTPAGGNLLWAANAEVDGELHQIVGVTLGVQDAKLLREKVDLAIDHSINVIAATQQGITSAVAVKKGQVVGYVDDGLGGRTAVVAAKDLKAIGWAGHRVSIEINDGGKKLPGTAKSGQVVGQISVGTGPGKVTAPIELQQDLAEPGFGAKLTRLG
ncbi:D-alanyl-D-alanine carboxypeptidase [Streptomyces sp. NBC_00690]|uniref:D-alanyl-D-alanine carboxypeptidase n=1 Tax=Streptomyces sp. NBC_00690 TaxID=2975808 RepID=UPI002E291E29|nr:D-alanyl-D-alanine carboxypeptidase [Streptomyces sp. NBC_00690]